MRKETLKVAEHDNLENLENIAYKSGIVGGKTKFYFLSLVVGGC